MSQKVVKYHEAKVYRDLKQQIRITALLKYSNTNPVHKGKVLSIPQLINQSIN